MTILLRILAGDYARCGDMFGTDQKRQGDGQIPAPVDIVDVIP